MSAISKSIFLAMYFGAIYSIVPAHADPAADAARKAIQSQYDHSNAACSKKDLKGFVAILSPTYTEVDAKGRSLTYKVVRQRMALKFSQTASVNGTVSIASIKVSGGSATLKTKVHHTYVFASPQTGSVSKMVVDSDCEDVWVQNGATWLESSSKVISEKTTIDGKVVPGV